MFSSNSQRLELMAKKGTIWAKSKNYQMFVCLRSKRRSNQLSYLTQEKNRSLLKENSFIHTNHPISNNLHPKRTLSQCKLSLWIPIKNPAKIKRKGTALNMSNQIQRKSREFQLLSLRIVQRRVLKRKKKGRGSQPKNLNIVSRRAVLWKKALETLTKDSWLMKPIKTHLMFNSTSQLKE